MTALASKLTPEIDPQGPGRGNLTAEQTMRVNALLDWVNKEKETNKKFSEATLCRAAALSQQIWAPLKQGKYTQPNRIEKHLTKLELARRTLETAGILTAPEVPSVAADTSERIENSMIKDLRSSVDTCLKLAGLGSEDKLTFLAAPTGRGKTFSSRVLVQEFTGYACNAQRDWKSSNKCMMQDLATILGIPWTDRDPVYKISRAIKGHFKTPKVLILNELGPHTFNASMVVWVREMLNETAAVIVLCAVPELLDILERTMRDELDQVRRRGRFVRSAPITAEEVQWFMRKMRQTTIDNTAAEMIATAANEFGGYCCVKFVGARLKHDLQTPESGAAALADYSNSREVKKSQPRSRGR